ncbi:MAG TPA: hypothetical protein VD886_25915 [Herpetosiphonaceae bacterium]|nr:hypothetical protein [Herpetosiphonaceae bacterium]
MTPTTTWLRGRHRRVMRGLRIFFGVQIIFSVGLALALDLAGGRQPTWLALGSGLLVGLLLLPALRRWLRWTYIPILLGVDLVHVTTLLWVAAEPTLARGSLWALAYIPVLVAAGRWWGYAGGAVALSLVLAVDGAVLFARLPASEALPVFVFQAVTAALGAWAAAQSEARARRDLLKAEAAQLIEERAVATTRAYAGLAAQLKQLEGALASAADHLPPDAPAAGHLVQARALLDEAGAGLHRTLRDVGGLPLAGRTLPEALAAELRFLRQEASLDTTFSCDGHLPATRPLVTEYLWRVAQVALANVRAHANARKVVVDLYGEHGAVILRIADDGVGFDSSLLTAADSSASLALLGAQAGPLQAHFSIASQDSSGTQVEARVPALRPARH